MDGAISLVILATPLLAIRYGAGSLMLGTIGWVPQVVRLPLCLTSGHLSEKLGRKTVAASGALIMAVGAYGLTLARTNWQIILPYTLVIGAIGVFYAPLQALIGDVSTRPGELTTNLGWYNIGWCVGSTLCTVLGAWLVKISLAAVLYTGALAFIVALVIVLIWPTGARQKRIEAQDDAPSGPAYPPQLLLAARIALFTQYFGVMSIRMLYPKLAKTLGWSDPVIAWLLAALMAGMGFSMIVCKASSWWKGRFWPVAAALVVYMACGLGGAFLRTPVFIAVCFFAIGAAVGVVYTTALYHAVSDRKAKGGNAGIHEFLVAGGAVFACLIGGFIADRISLPAPYVAFSMLSALSLTWVVRLWRGALYTGRVSL